MGREKRGPVKERKRRRRRRRRRSSNQGKKKKKNKKNKNKRDASVACLGRTVPFQEKDLNCGCRGHEASGPMTFSSSSMKRKRGEAEPCSPCHH